MSNIVNLRKAAAIQSEIRNYLTKISLDTSVNSPLDFETAKKLLENGRTELAEKLNLYLRLNEILYDIRTKVQKANCDSGISALLTKDYSLKQRMKVLDQLAGSRPVTDLPMKVIAEMINKAKSENNDSHFSRSTHSIRLNFVTTEFIDNTVGSLLIDSKREKTKINEQILALNVKTEIEIALEDYQYLQKLGVI